MYSDFFCSFYIFLVPSCQVTINFQRWVQYAYRRSWTKLYLLAWWQFDLKPVAAAHKSPAVHVLYFNRSVFFFSSFVYVFYNFLVPELCWCIDTYSVIKPDILT